MSYVSMPRNCWASGFYILSTFFTTRFATISSRLSNDTNVTWSACSCVSWQSAYTSDRTSARCRMTNTLDCLHLVTCPTEPCLNVCLSCKHYCNILKKKKREQEKEIKSWLELKGVHLLSASIACHNIIDKTALSFFSSVYDM